MDIKVENEDINLMCHGCLATDRKLRRIRGEFRKMFQFLRNDDNIDVLSLELLLCWECIGFLKKLKMFRARIRKAECLLVTYLKNNCNEDGYTNPQSLSSLKNTHIYTNEYYAEQKMMLDIANNENVEEARKEKEDQSEVELIADIKMESNQNIKEERNSSNYKECNSNNNEQQNYSDDNYSDYNDTELKIEKDNIVKSATIKEKIVNNYDKIEKSATIKEKIVNNNERITVTKTRNVNDSNHNDTGCKTDKKDDTNKSSKDKKKIKSLQSTAITHKYQKLATITKKKDFMKNKYYQYAKSVCLSQKEYETVLARDIRYHNIVKKMKFQCNKCELLYFTNLDLLRHISFRHNKQATFPYKCAACTTMITSPEHLDSHWTESHTKMLKCTLCSEVFRTMPEIKMHVYKQHTKNYGCKECGQEFGMLQYFKEHYKEMHEKAICDYCNKSFTKKEFLLSHIMGTHTPAYCKLCDRHFRHHSSYKKHNSYTHPELTLQGETRKELSYCVECDKQYPSVQIYRKHLKDSVRHTPQKKIRVPCPECGKIFSKKQFMKNHYKLFHLKVTKHYCKECDKYFANGFGLRTHVKRIHEKIPLPRDKYCDICGRGFTSNRILLNHRRTHTGERPYKCSFCPAAFGQRSAMTTHQKTQHKNLDLPS